MYSGAKLTNKNRFLNKSRGRRTCNVLFSNDHMFVNLSTASFANCPTLLFDISLGLWPTEVQR